MKIRFGLAVLLVLWGGRGIAQERSYFFPQSTSQEAAPNGATDEETLVPSPQMSMFGSGEGRRAPGGDYGLGQPLCAPQYTRGPKADCNKGSMWWCNPCGFGGWGCGTPVRTAARNLNLQLKSLWPCGSWCQSRGCNCSGQSPYAMDWSQPDRRSCPCDCKGSHYLFPWIWNYQPSRGGCCNNHWTQRGDGYRSALQFSPPVTAQMEEVAPTPAAPADVDEPRTSQSVLRNVSHSAASPSAGSPSGSAKKPLTASIREVAPGADDELAQEGGSVRKPATGALSANYLARLAPPKRREEPSTRVAEPLPKESSRRR